MISNVIVATRPTSQEISKPLTMQPSKTSAKSLLPCSIVNDGSALLGTIVCVYGPAPAFVLLGAEGAGLSAALVRQADAAVRVPMRADVDSLNVGITASIIAYEARRQRDLRVRML